MELLFVTVIGAGLGMIARYVFPQRRTYGALLVPAIAAAATAVVWVVLLWIGLTFDGTWIWVISLAAALVASIVSVLVIPRRRDTADARLLAELSRPAAASGSKA